MKKGLLLLVCLLLPTISLLAQRDTLMPHKGLRDRPAIIDGEHQFHLPSAGAFVNSLKPKDSVKAFFLSSSNGLPDVYEDTAKIFNDTGYTQLDVAFFQKQLLDAHSREWTVKDSVWGATIISQGEILELSRKGMAGWDKFKKKYGKGFFVYSIPVFNVHGNKAIMVSSYHSGKELRGAIYLYEKTDGKWKVAKTYSTWGY